MMSNETATVRNGQVVNFFLPIHILGFDNLRLLFKRKLYMGLQMIRYVACVFLVANPPGMGERLPQFNPISRLPPDVAREMIISRNASNLVLYRLIVEY